MSSRDGCWPISSSNGSMYSSTGPGSEKGDRQSPRQMHYSSINTNTWSVLPAWSFHTISSFAAWGELPQHQAQSVHVYPQEGVSLEVNGPLQDLGGHVPPGPHLTHKQGHILKRWWCQSLSSVIVSPALITIVEGRYYKVIYVHIKLFEDVKLQFI